MIVLRALAVYLVRVTSIGNAMPANIGQWRLQDAKARFSEVVRRARAEGPQRVTLHGRDAVVVIDAAAFDRARETATGQRLIDALAASPLGDIEFERVADAGPVRTVEL